MLEIKWDSVDGVVVVSYWVDKVILLRETSKAKLQRYFLTTKTMDTQI